MIRRSPTSTLFPYTTLFRSADLITRITEVVGATRVQIADAATTAVNNGLAFVETPITQIVVHGTVSPEQVGLDTLTRDETTGSHYLVSRQGRITDVISEGDRAVHAGPDDWAAIGIELIDDARFAGNVQVAGTGTTSTHS